MRTGILLIALLALVALLMWRFPYALQDADERMRLVYLVALLLLVGGGARFARAGTSHAVRNAAIWVAIVMALMVGYSFRDDLGHNRFIAELMPSRVQVTAEGDLSIRSGEDGHFHVEAEVNGAPLRFMIDTGASDIVLSPRAAAQAGYDVDTLNYTRAYETANGIVKGAPVRLRVMRVGPVTLRDVPASVNGAAMDQSLLGMAFLKRFKSYRVDGNTLTLTPYPEAMP